MISEIWLLLQCAVALQRALYEADALEQRRPCTRTNAMSNFNLHTQNGRSLEPWNASLCGFGWMVTSVVTVANLASFPAISDLFSKKQKQTKKA